MKIREDFVVEANGRCFFCLITVTPPFLHEPCLLTSLQYLSRYLGMDMKNIFNERSHVPPDLLSKVESARLKVQLCGNCSRLTESFSKMYRHLEKVEMEVATFANRIQRKLKDADEMGKAEQYLNVAEPDLNLTNVGLKGKLEIIKILREEVKQKCIDKCEPIYPSVKIKKMTKRQVKEERLKIKQTSQNTITNDWKKFEDMTRRLSHQNDDIGNIKGEYNVSSPFLDDANDNDDDGHISDDIALPDQHDLSNQSQEPTGTMPHSLRNRHETVIQGSQNDLEKFQCIFNSQTGKYECKLCGKELGSKLACRIHYNGVHANVKYKCNLCSKEFSQLSTYHRHRQSVHMKVRFKCQACNKTFTQKGHLTTHLKMSKGCRPGKVELKV